jgi:hypothetical protein
MHRYRNDMRGGRENIAEKAKVDIVSRREQNSRFEEIPRLEWLHKEAECEMGRK